jgi:Berberine and berberine like
MKDVELTQPRLMIPIYAAGDDSVEADALQLGNKFRSILENTSGTPGKHVYVNFAIGDETKEAVYGSEAKREKLVELKKKWDPQGRFNQYNPIC